MNVDGRMQQLGKSRKKIESKDGPMAQPARVNRQAEVKKDEDFTQKTSCSAERKANDLRILFLKRFVLGGC